jgi:hypothetical protein
MEGNKEIYLRSQVNNPLLGGKSMVQCFAELDSYLASYLAVTGRDCDYDGHHLAIDSSSREEQMAMTVLKATADLDVLALLESWAKTSEFWSSGTEGSSYSEGLFPGSFTIEQSRYYFLIDHARKYIHTSDQQRFIWTYAALCEFSLFGPILPRHSKLRGDKPTLAEIHPLSRFLSLLRAAAEIEPIRDLSADYRRFIEEICSATKWPSPFAMDEGISFRHVPQDIWGEWYHRAQALRAHVPAAFIDLSCWFTPKNDFTRELTYYFTHSVIEFKDKLLFHKNRDMVALFVSQYAGNEYFRKVLLSDDVTIRLPFGSNTAARELCEGVMADVLSTLGIRDTKIVVEGIMEGPECRLVR